MQALVREVVGKESPLVASALRKAAKEGDSITPALATFFQRMDQASASVPQRLACENGCSYCCHYHVYVYPVEAFALANFVKKLDEKTQTAIKDRLAHNIEQTSTLTVDEHIATNVRCALLDDNGKCIAYALRPSACRKHHSLSGISCKVTFEDTASPMENVLSPAREALSVGFMLSLMEGARAAGVDTMRYEMNGALSEALDNPACLKRWKSGKVSFASVRDKSDAL